MGPEDEVGTASTFSVHVHTISTLNCWSFFPNISIKKNLTWLLPGYCFFFEAERPGHQEDLTFEAEVEVEGAAVSKVARSAILKSDFCQDTMPVASSSHPINTQRFDSSSRNLVLVLSFHVSDPVLRNFLTPGSLTCPGSLFVLSFFVSHPVWVSVKISEVWLIIQDSYPFFCLLSSVEKRNGVGQSRSILVVSLHVFSLSGVAVSVYIT